MKYTKPLLTKMKPCNSGLLRSLYKLLKVYSTQHLLAEKQLNKLQVYQTQLQQKLDDIDTDNFLEVIILTPLFKQKIHVNLILLVLQEKRVEQLQELEQSACTDYANFLSSTCKEENRKGLTLSIVGLSTL